MGKGQRWAWKTNSFYREQATETKLAQMRAFTKRCSVLPEKIERGNRERWRSTTQKCMKTTGRGNAVLFAKPLRGSFWQVSPKQGRREKERAEDKCATRFKTRQLKTVGN